MKPVRILNLCKDMLGAEPGANENKYEFYFFLCLTALKVLSSLKQIYLQCTVCLCHI